MNTVESLYRYYKKIGPRSFEDFINKNPHFREMAEKVLAMDHIQKSTVVR